MALPEPFVHEAGSGPAVLCVHSNASSSAQWRGLMDRLSPRFRVLAPDSWGAGRSPEWPADRALTLGDEVALLAPLLDRIDGPLVLVGHSYGGAVALMAALAHPGRVRAMALYEPTLFALLDQAGPPPNEADGIRVAVARAAAAFDAGDPDAGTRHFIDYWSGEGSWARTPAERKPAIVSATRHVRRWAHALTNEPTPLAAFRSLDIPVLVMTGSLSTAAAHGVARELKAALPQVQAMHFDGLGHMAPLTHADTVNDAMQRFIEGL
jgi:pimeloyl-ACP methyl ester carboxylesterase